MGGEIKAQILLRAPSSASVADKPSWQGTPGLRAPISPRWAGRTRTHPTGFLESVQASSRAPSGKVSVWSSFLLILAKLEPTTSHPHQEDVPGCLVGTSPCSYPRYPSLIQTERHHQGPCRGMRVGILSYNIEADFLS